MNKLLLVGDDDIVRAGLCLLLKSDGWKTVQLASDRDQAWACLDSGDWELVIIDAPLKDLDAIVLAGLIRRSFRVLPILILGIHSEPAMVRAATRAGVNGYLVKQASSQELLIAARCLLHGGFYLDARVAAPFLASMDGRLETQREAVVNRKRVILAAIRRGHSNLDMADQLNVSPSTVKAHLRELFMEHGVKDRLGLLMVNQDRAG